MSTEEKVIEAVRKYPELYDTKHTNYMKSKLKTRIWMNIAKELNLRDGEETKNIWLKLRGGYRDARRRHKKSYISGAPLQQIRPWKYQNQMSFLEPFMSCGPREGNIVDDSDDETQILSDPAENSHSEVHGVTFNGGENQRSHQLHLDETGVSIDEENNEIEQPPTGEERHSSDGRELLFQAASPKQHIPPPPKKKKQTVLQDIVAQSMKQREERARQRTEDRRKLLEESQNSNDPMFNFFMSMYQLTKNMPNLYQHRIRAKVFQAVSEAEAEIMNLTSNRPSSTSSFQSSTPSPSNLTSLQSPHCSNSLSMPSIHHAHQIEQSPQDLQNDPGPHSFSLTNFISNYQCDQ